jgi:hypothetical protein
VSLAQRVVSSRTVLWHHTKFLPGKAVQSANHHLVQKAG